MYKSVKQNMSFQGQNLFVLFLFVCRICNFRLPCSDVKPTATIAMLVTIQNESFFRCKIGQTIQVKYFFLKWSYNPNIQCVGIPSSLLIELSLAMKVHCQIHAIHSFLQRHIIQEIGNSLKSREISRPQS